MLMSQDLKLSPLGCVMPNRLAVFVTCAAHPDPDVGRKGAAHPFDVQYPC